MASAQSLRLRIRIFTLLFIIGLVISGATAIPLEYELDAGAHFLVLVIPYAFVFGAVRGIPIYWRLIDCSFGVFGFIPLWLCYGWAAKLNEWPETSEV